MKLFHGSLVTVARPELLPTHGTKDLGSGFYTTSSVEQARRFVINKLRLRQSERGNVSE